MTRRQFSVSDYERIIAADILTTEPRDGYYRVVTVAMRGDLILGESEE